MKKNDERALWIEGQKIFVLDQRKLPHRVETVELQSCADACRAISDMTVRGAGVIGDAAACGMRLAARESLARGPEWLTECAQNLTGTRPTAANLRAAVDFMLNGLAGLRGAPLCERAERLADEWIQNGVKSSEKIAGHGLELIRRLSSGLERPFEILTHCNAGRLAIMDMGSALAPVYAAAKEGIPVHVWVDETRPRNQGAHLTAWELAQASIPHDLIADNAGGHLMRCGLADMVIVGADRVAANGDVANKIGTYLKALAAHDNNVPFYAAFLMATVDWDTPDGSMIPIEERGGEEVRFVSGARDDGSVASVRICPEGTPARNWGFDVTPARLITGFITELGVCEASGSGLRRLMAAHRSGQESAQR